MGIKSCDGCPWGYCEDFKFDIIIMFNGLHIPKFERSTGARSHLS